jgi:hypothetical protein
MYYSLYDAWSLNDLKIVGGTINSSATLAQIQYVHDFGVYGRNKLCAIAASPQQHAIFSASLCIHVASTGDTLYDIHVNGYGLYAHEALFIFYFYLIEVGSSRCVVHLEVLRKKRGYKVFFELKPK